MRRPVSPLQHLAFGGIAGKVAPKLMGLARFAGLTTPGGIAVNIAPSVYDLVKGMYENAAQYGAPRGGPGFKRGGKISKGKAKVGKVMGEFKRGELHSGSKKGPVVKNPKQAVAIALSEARKAGAKIPKKGR